MIIHGNQRSAQGLADHLLNERDNEHVTLHSVKGFACEDLRGALLESEAMAKGTRCRQHVFSISFNPPPGAKVSTEDFEKAIVQAEKKLGLEGQPRVAIFHEKHGRRHLHVVFCRINGETMTAIPMSHSKNRMRELSRSLFIAHQWDMPRGLQNSEERDRSNFTLEEWQEARRKGQDARVIKSAIQDAWATSDSQPALAHALAARGFRLARGDRRAAVVVDERGEVYALARWAGVKTSAVRERLPDVESLPSVDEAKASLAGETARKLDQFSAALRNDIRRCRADFENRRRAMVERQKTARMELAKTQKARALEEQRMRQARFRRGLAGLWDRLRGEHSRLKAEHAKEFEQSRQRDLSERDALIDRHLDERRRLDERLERELQKLGDRRQMIVVARQEFHGRGRVANEKARGREPEP